MAYEWLPYVAGAGAGIASEIIAGNQDAESDRKNRIFAEEEGNRQRAFEYRMWSENQAQQEKFAQMGLQWKVQDAIKAGIHPLAALGAQSTSFSPVSVGSSSTSGGFNSRGDSTRRIGGYLADMGQNLTRSLSATRTDAEKEMDALQVQGAKLNLQNQAMENELKAIELRRIKSGVGGPGTLSRLVPGQGSSGFIAQPNEITQSPADAPQTEAGVISNYGFARTKTGLRPVPSNDVKNRIEDQMIPETLWAIDAYGSPFIGSKRSQPSKIELQREFPGASDSYWDGRRFEWRPIYRGRYYEAN